MHYREEEYKRAFIQSIKHDFDFINYACCIKEELPLRKNRLDLLLLFNGSNNHEVVEIKTDEDNLDRLENQIEGYYKVFTFVSVLTCKKYLEEVQKIVPSKTGIYFYENGKVNRLRSAVVKYDCLKHDEINFLLRQKENHEIAKKYNIDLFSKNRFDHFTEHKLAFIENLSIYDYYYEAMKCLRKRYFNEKDMLINMF